MKKILLIFSTAILFLMAPTYSYATNGSALQFNGSEDSHTFEVDGETYTLTLVTNNDVQTAFLESEDGVETISYDSRKDEIRINDELLDEAALEEIKGISNELSQNLGLIGSEIVDSKISALADDGYYWRHVNTFKDSFNVTVFSVVIVTAIILALPTGTGIVFGIMFGAKAVSTLVSAIVYSSSDDNQKVYYYTIDTYFSNYGGFWNNKFVVSTYTNSSRTKLLDTFEHTTRYGKNYN
ncbi:hypothetical protein [Sporosarcina sp. FSL K6-3457]|uniref:hypothetical protein n=1 Tax=Sporosarcina sp. FSL K6-3457 TaxID=2978204 RepID=UPI0030F8F7EC